MKIKGLLMALAIFGFANLSNAQVDATANPLRLIFAGVGVAADVVVADNISVEIGAAYGRRSVKILGEEFFRFTNLPITLIGKYYFNPEDGADGFYSGLFARYVTRNYSDVDLDETTDNGYTRSKFGLGLAAGYKIVSDKGIVFDIGFGAGRTISKNTTYNDETTIGTFTLNSWTDIMLVTKLSVGYRFGG